MTVIEARYVGPFKVPHWGTWFKWQEYNLSYYANKAMVQLEKQFSGLYEFRLKAKSETIPNAAALG